MATSIWIKTCKELEANVSSSENVDEWIWHRALLLSGDMAEILSGSKDGTVSIKIEDSQSRFDGITFEMSTKSAADVIVPLDDFHALPPNDLTELTHLHEPALVDSLRKRYEAGQIYTSTGPILLALNPFKNNTDLYSEDMMTLYWERGELGNAGTGVDETLGQLPPHVYHVADSAFRTIMRSFEMNMDVPSFYNADDGDDVSKGNDQSVLVSGESGAGKTVTTNHIIKYLSMLSQIKAKYRTSNELFKRSASKRRSTLSKSVSGRQLTRVVSWKAGSKVDEKIQQASPVLESFGNARTVRNDNSSRFGKLIELKFKETGSLMGASIETYLLEKIRLSHQGEGERNYHVFYELLEGASEEERNDYFLGDYTPEDFKMTNQSGIYDRRDEVDDVDEYMDLVYAMGTLSFEMENQIDVFKIVSALLHASNLTFVELNADESELDKDNLHLEAVLNLLGLEHDAFSKALCSYCVKIGRDTYFRTLCKTKAVNGIEALIRSIYGALFSYIVEKINRTIEYTPASESQTACISVLDIFGFESFEKNSFEQLCINYCNEMLQQQFNSFIFTTEQDEYEKEEIIWSLVSFPDNQEILDLIDKKGFGLIQTLDDYCKAPKATDKVFADTIYKKYDRHSRFGADFRQKGRGTFVLEHFAGFVEYDTNGFVEKNKDEVPKDAADMLELSSNIFVQKLARIINSTKASATLKTKRTTVGFQFTQQLQILRKRIKETTPHYIRCLKPNDDLVPNSFSTVRISDQLRRGGMVEAVRVSRMGYPQRYLHSFFVERYYMLAPDFIKTSSSKEECSALIRAVKPVVLAMIPAVDRSDRIIQMGKTKVFLRDIFFSKLEMLRASKVEGAVKLIQSYGRIPLAKKKFEILKTEKAAEEIRQKAAAEEAARAKAAAKEVELAKVAAAEAQRAKVAAEEAERAKSAAEEADRAKAAAEEADRAKAAAEEADRAKAVAEEAERAKAAKDEEKIVHTGARFSSSIEEVSFISENSSEKENNGNTSILNDKQFQLANDLRPGDEMITITAPPGKLGIFLFNNSRMKGCLVSSVRPESVLHDKILTGDKIVEFNGIDVSTMSARDVTKMISDHKDKVRILKIYRSEATMKLFKQLSIGSMYGSLIGLNDKETSVAHLHGGISTRFETKRSLSTKKVDKMKAKKKNRFLNALSRSNKETSKSETLNFIAPPGKLGMFLSDCQSGKGCCISFLRPTSPLTDDVYPGDKVIGVNGKDVSKFSARELTKYVAELVNEERIFKILREDDPSKVGTIASSLLQS